MKTKQIIAALLLVSGAAGAQNTFPTGAGTQAGIGTTSPNDQLEIIAPAGANAGVTIKNNGTHASWIRLRNTNTGGRDWLVATLGSSNTPGAGHFVINDVGTGLDRMFIEGTTGNVGFGTSAPSAKVHASSGVPNDGMWITQTSAHAAALHMENQTFGGRHWALFSTGSGNNQLSGNFSIYDYNSNADRFFIEGASGNVGIGTILVPNARLEIEDDNTGTFNRCVYANGYNSTGNLNWNAGLEGVGGSSNTSDDNYGVRGRSVNGGTGTGGYFSAVGNANSSTGIYATASGANPWAGVFSGNVWAWSFQPSDRKLKENIEPLQGALDKIMLLKPAVYNYKVDEFADMHLPAGRQMGLIAQELEQVFPELVKELKNMSKTNDKGEVTDRFVDSKSLNYTGLIPLLIAGMQEQQTTIDAQQKKIELLEQTQNGTTGVNEQTIGFRMAQNEPNPFTHETVIKFTLPASVNNAYMAVYDLTGKQITTFAIQEKGESSITLTAEKLDAGIYIYSIVADGKVLDSKRMVVAGK